MENVTKLTTTLQNCTKSAKTEQTIDFIRVNLVKDIVPGTHKVRKQIVLIFNISVNNWKSRQKLNTENE